MPAPELTSRHQKAVLWKRISEDRYGIPTIQAAQEITVRWENMKGELLNDKNQVIGFDATIHTVESIPVGSLVWEGKLSTLPDDTTSLTGLMQVIFCQDAYDIKGRALRREYKLKRFTERLPTVSV